MRRRFNQMSFWFFATSLLVFHIPISIVVCCACVRHAPSLAWTKKTWWEKHREHDTFGRLVWNEHVHWILCNFGMAYVISRNNLIKGEEVWAPPCTNCVCGYHFQPGNHNLYFHISKACAFNFDSSCGFIRPRNAKTAALQAILSSSSTNCVKTKSGAIIMLITKIFCECRQSVAIKGKVIANQCSTVISL